MHPLRKLLAPFALSLIPASAAANTCDDCNVLWIVIDAMQASYLGCYGNDQGNTPNIDALAERGTVFEAVYSQGVATLPSVSSYLSGRYRISTGMDFYLFQRNELYHPLSDELMMVAEVLAAKGLRTRGYNANGIIARGIEYDINVYQGFETWAQPGGEGEDGIVRKAIDGLNELRDERFFVYLHIMGPHTPNHPTEEFEARRGSHGDGMPEPIAKTYSSVNKGERQFSPEETQYLRDCYADALWSSDRRIGLVLDSLATLGLKDKTMVILTSDHGEMLGQLDYGRPRWGHGHSMKRAGLHVPLVIAGPGIPAGARKGQMAELVDLAPTITGYLEIDVDPAWRWEGQPLLGPNAVEGEWAITDRGDRERIAVSVRNRSHSVFRGEGGKTKYYDLTSDPDETTPVEPTEVHQALVIRLEEYLKNANPPEMTDANPPLDDEKLQQLEALGYVE